MKSLPVGTSYAIWVGVGAVGTAILGMVLFGESANAGRLVSLAWISTHRSSAKHRRGLDCLGCAALLRRGPAVMVRSAS
jgi:hypothetical protein